MSHSKQYLGKYHGTVVSVEDPEKRCRVKVCVDNLFDGVPVDDLPWANQILPLGSRGGEGAVNPMQVGDEVWVEFVGGDSRRPMVSGASQSAPEGKVNLAPDVSGGEGYSHKRTDKQPEAEQPNYYEDVCYKQNGSMIQMCRSGTVRITQMSSGSAVELTNGGDVIIHCEGKMYVSVQGDYIEEINGDYTQQINGKATTKANGEYVIQGAIVRIN